MRRLDRALHLLCLGSAILNRHNPHIAVDFIKDCGLCSQVAHRKRMQLGALIKASIKRNNADKISPALFIQQRRI